MKNFDDLITVIVPVYKVEKYLPRCIDSIINQTYQNLEIILVDDGSPDECGKICDEYAKKDGRIKVIHKENGGLSSARNAALDVANGEYIGFVDSDDWIEADMYEEMYMQITASGADMACCGRYNVYENKPTSELFVLKEPCLMDSKAAIARALTWNGMDSAACDKLYHKSLFDNIRYPLGKINEDIAIAFRIMEKTKKIIHIGKPKYYYFHRENSITTSDFSVKNLDLLEINNTVRKELMHKYPELTKEISYFYLHNIAYLHTGIIDGDLAKKLNDEYKQLRGILLKNTIAYICNKFTIREKVKTVLAVYVPYVYKKCRKK